MPKVNVKWGKNSYDVDVDTSMGFETFQATLYSLTNVPLERQKIMHKGKFIKNDTELSALTDDAKLTLLGTPDSALPVAPPSKPVVFEEDLTDAQKVQLKATDGVASGLTNLGNTCYMNSTLQCFRAVPELKSELIKFSNEHSNALTMTRTDPNSAVTAQLGRLIAEMDNTTAAVTPLLFTSIFRNVFPQFAEKDNEGHWMQQDADECLSQLMSAMAQKLVAPTDSAVNPWSTAAAAASASNMIDYYFAGELSSVMHCVESDAEPDRVDREPFRKLRCAINSDVNFLSEGLAKDLSQEIEMKSQVLGRTALFKKQSKISVLPRYLIVQFVRFDWRKDTQKKSKIMRKVEFPLKLDITDFCAKPLARSLLAARRALKDEEDAKIGLKPIDKGKNYAAIKAAADKRDAEAKAKAAEKAAEKKAAEGKNDEIAMEIDSISSSTEYEAVDGSGFYGLIGCVTHKGRYADSGHYIGWTRANTDTDEWLKFDDDTVSKATSDEIKLLCGGGDRDMTYINIYKRIDDFKGRTLQQLSASATTADDTTTSTPVGATQ